MIKFTLIMGYLECAAFFMLGIASYPRNAHLIYFGLFVAMFILNFLLLETQVKRKSLNWKINNLDHDIIRIITENELFDKP